MLRSHPDRIDAVLDSLIVDLELLGRHNPVTGGVKQPGCFASLVQAIRHERERMGLSRTDWTVIKNRVRHTERKQAERIDAALHELAECNHFRVGHGLSERVAFRELFQFGLTHLDLRHLPGMARVKASTACEINDMLDDLALEMAPQRKPRSERPCPRVLASTRTAYGDALDALL